MATITSLDFDVKSNWDGSGIRAARADLDLLKTDLDELAAKSADIKITIDDSAAKASIDALKADIDSITNKSITLSIDDTAAKAAIADLKADLDSISNKSIRLTIDDSAAKLAITDLKADIDSISNKSITLSVNDTAAKAALDALKLKLDQIGATHTTVNVTVKTDTSKLDALKAELTAVGAMHVTANATTKVNSAELDALQAKLSKVGSEHVTATAGVNVNSAALDALQAKLSKIGSEHETATATVNTNSANLSALEAELTTFGRRHDTASADVNTDSAHTHLRRMSDDASATAKDVGILATIAGGAGSVIGGLANAVGGAATAIGGMANSAGGAGGALTSMGDAAGGASGGLGSMGGAMGTIVLWGSLIIALMPVVAASVIAVPLAFIGVAAILIQKNKELKKSFQEAFQDTMQQIIPLAKPVMDAIIAALQQLDGWLKLIGPAIHDAFAAAAPLVQPLLSIIEKLIGGALPGFTLAMRGMGPLIDGLGQGALKFGGYLGQAANVLARIPGLGQAMNGIMGAAGQVLLSVAQAIAQVVAVDHGQALIQILQALSVTIKASIPFLQLWDFLMVGLAVIIRGLSDAMIFFEAVGRVVWKECAILFQAMFTVFETTFKIFKDVFTGNWTGAWNAIKDGAKAIWDLMGKSWDNTVGKLGLTWKTAGKGLEIAWKASWDGMKIAAEAIWDGLKIAWQATVNGLITAWNVVSGALKTAWDAVWNAMKVAAQAIWDAMKVAWSAVVTAFSTVWTTVSSALRTAWDAVWNAMKVSAQAIWTAMQVAWSAVVTAFATVWTTVSNALTTAWNAVWNALKTAAQAIWTAMQVAWSAFVNALATTWSTVSAALTTAWNAVWNALKTAAQAIWTAMQVAWQAFITALQTIWQTVSSALSASWSAIWNAMKTVATAIWSGLQTAWSAFWTAMRDLFNAAMGAIQTSWSLVWNAIKTVGEAIWNGMRTAWDAFWSGMRTVFVGAMDAIKSGWDAAWNTIKSVAIAIWGGIRSAWNSFSSGFVTAVKDTVGVIKTVWGGLEEAFKAPVHFVVATVINGGIIKAINWVIGKLGGSSTAIPNVPVPFASGGHVKGPGTSTSDSIPARLSDGEFVMNANAVNRIGVDKLHQMNSGNVDVAKLSPQAQFLGRGIDPATLKSNMTGGFADGGLSISDIESMFGDIIKTIGGAGAGLLAKGISSAGSLAKAVGSGVQSGANAVGNAAGHIPVVGGGLKSGLKALGGLFGGGGKAVSSATNAIASALDAWGKKEFESAAGDLIEKVFSKLPIPGGSGPLGELGAGAVKEMMKASATKLKDLIASFLFTKQQQQIAVTSSSVAGSKSVQAWTPVVLQALAMEGHPASWVGPIEQTMQKESGGNPNAINRTDINAQHGIPSQGLMQVIPPTFARYHEAGTSNNILDPLANIAAAINYIVARYGRPTGMSPYANGTSSATPGAHLVGENGPEMVMFGGGEKVLTASQTSGALAGAQLPLEQMAANRALWNEYVTNLASTSKVSWDSIKQNTDQNLTTMGAAVSPFTTMVKGLFNTTGSEIATQWKQNWTANTTLFHNNLASSQIDATGFNETLKRNFEETGASLGTTWKQDWNNNGTVLLTDLTTAQSNATNFQSTLKSNFANNGTAVSAQWKQDWDTNGTVLQNDLNTSQTNATSFQNTLKTNFASNGTAVAAQWKQDWDTNQTVMTNDLNTTQTNATGFQNTLKANFASNGTAVGTAWKAMWDKATTDANTDYTTMGTNATNMWNGTKATFTAGAAYLTNTFFPPVNDLMVNKLPASFTTSVNNIGAGWLKIEGATHDPIAAVVNTVYNKGIVGVWNLIAKAFGAPALATFTMPGFATGGQVNGPGTGTSDSIVARLSAGEHIWTAGEVQAAGGHQAVARMRSHVMGGAPVRAMGNQGYRFPTGGGVPPATTGGNPVAPTGAPTAAGSAAPAAATGGLAQLASLTLGSIAAVANPLITAAVTAGKTAVDAVTVAGSGMRTAGEGMGTVMGKATTDFITAHDVAPFLVGGGSTASAQAWADAQVGKPYSLGTFGSTFDCSTYQSGIARAILGQTPAPWFTTFAFNGSTAPPGFVQNLQAPYMVGVENVGIGHMSGTLNGKNYEATPPAVRSGPGARGWNDPLFSMHYGFQPSIQAAAVAGSLPANASHLQIIDAAMAAAHVPPPDSQAAWESGLNIIITHESAWNPNAINRTDINAINGIPSQGLAQVIPPTFAAYHVPGTSTNILDPIANVAAAIRYIVARYGSINSVPGVRSVNAGGAYLPYRNGTDNASMGWHLVGEDGPEVRWFNGGEKVWDAKKSKDWMEKVGASPTTTTNADDLGHKIADAVKECLHDSGAAGGVNISMPVHVEGGSNGQDVVARIEAELLPKLRMMMEQHVGWNRGRR